MSAYEQILDRLGDAVTRRNGDQAEARCPAHDDQRASLSIGVRDRGDPGALIDCKAGCTLKAVLEAIGLESGALYDQWWERRNGGGDPIAVYRYTDEDGKVLFEVGRFPRKRFLQRGPAAIARGDWTGGIKGVRRVLYRLPKVIEAREAGKRIWVVEGEECVHALERIGEVATCNPMGADMWKETYGYSEFLRGATVIVVADRDKAGREHAVQVAASLEGVGASVRVVESRAEHDVRDHLAAGMTLDDFVPLRTGTRESISFGFRRADPSRMRPVEFVWWPWIVRGRLNLMVGEEKVGKSTLTAYIAAAITNGTLPGTYEGKPADVLFVGADEDDWNSVTLPRLHAAGADLGRVHELYAKDECGLFDAEAHAGELGELLAHHHTTSLGNGVVGNGGGGFALVVFEHLMDVLPRMTNYNDPPAIRRALRPLRRVLAARDVPGLGALHVNKAQVMEFRQRAQGSMQFGAMARSSFLIDRHPSDPYRRVMVLAPVNYVRGDQANALAFKIEDYPFSANGEPFSVGRVVDVEADDTSMEDVLAARESTRDQRRRERLEQVRAALTQEPQSATAIAEATDIPASSVQRYLEALGDDGLARKENDGWIVSQHDDEEDDE